MRVEYGFCPGCDAEIADKCDSCASRTPNRKYTEVTMPMTNGSKIVIACCVDCAKDNAIFKMDKVEFMRLQKEAWEKEHRNRPREVLEKHRELTKGWALK